MIYYVVFLGLMTLENVREVLTLEYSTCFINNLNKTKSKQGHIPDQIPRNFQHIREAGQEKEDKQILNMRRRNKTKVEISNQHLYLDTSNAPYFVVVLSKAQATKSDTLCGGSILDHCHVLTAAHCVSLRITDHPTTRFQVLDNKEVFIFANAADYDESTYDSDEAKGIWVHPEYLLKPEVESYRDIAVIQTKLMITSSKKQMAQIHPLIQNKDVSKLKKCSIVDWYSFQKNVIDLDWVTLMSQEDCKTKIKTMDKDVHVCILDVEQYVCHKESGMGLFCEGMLLAVTSWATTVGSGETSSCVYARVDNALDFITPVLNKVKCQAASFRPTLTTLFSLVLLHYTQY